MVLSLVLLRSGMEERYDEVDISQNEKGSNDFDARVSKNSSILERIYIKRVDINILE